MLKTFLYIGVIVLFCYLKGVFIGVGDPYQEVNRPGNTYNSSLKNESTF